MVIIEPAGMLAWKTAVYLVVVVSPHVVHTLISFPWPLQNSSVAIIIVFVRRNPLALSYKKWSWLPIPVRDH